MKGVQFLVTCIKLFFWAVETGIGVFVLAIVSAGLAYCQRNPQGAAQRPYLSSARCRSELGLHMPSIVWQPSSRYYCYTDL